MYLKSNHGHKLNFIKFQLIALSIVFSSCAPYLKKSNLESVEFTPKNDKSKKTLTVRALYRTLRFYNGEKADSVTIGSEQDLTDFVMKTVQLSGQYNASEIDKGLSSSVSFNGVESKEEQVLRKIPFPCATDYYLDVIQQHEVHGYHSVRLSIIGLAHLVSLGLLPLTESVNEKFNISLYRCNGELISNSIVNGESNVWYWSPQIFWNGFVIFKSDKKVIEPLQKVVLDNALKRLN